MQAILASRRLATAMTAIGLAIAVTALPGHQALSQAPATVATSPIAGVWIDHTGRGAVEITPCGTSLCGRIVWTKDAADGKGQPLRDMQNPDRAKRGQPICGLQIIGDLKAQRDGTWDNGWIYDPEKGEQFSLELTLRRPDVLQVKGYLGIKMLSETFEWKRAPADQPRCSV
jgi:uncharacterized protein (DUF2147 family)